MNLVSNGSLPTTPFSGPGEREEARAKKVAWTFGELYPLLKQNIKWIKEPKKYEILSRIIELLSQHILEKPDFYKGSGVRCRKSEIVYVDTKTDKEYPLSNTFWLKLSDDENSFRVQIYGKEIGRGSFKVVKESTTLKFPLLSGAKKLAKQKETVLVRSIRNKSFEEDSFHDDSGIEGMIDTLEIMRSLFTAEERKKLNLGGIPEQIRQYTGKNGYKIEWESKRYLVDFAKAADEHKVEIGQSGKIIRFSMSDKCRILESVLHTLRAMHDKAIVHGDVHRKNILLYLHPETKQLDADLIDFDIIGHIGESWSRNKPSEFPFWDRYFQKQGLILPTTDLFGVTMSLASAVFGFDLLFELNEERKNDDYDQIEKLIDTSCQQYVENIIKQLLDAVQGTDEEKSQIEQFPQRILAIKKETAQKKSGSNNDKIKEEIEKIANAAPNSTETIRQFLAYCYVYYAMSELLWDMYQEDKKLYDFMTGTSEGKAIVSFIQLAANSLEDIRGKMQEIYKRCPLFAVLEERIKSIREGFETLYK